VAKFAGSIAENFVCCCETRGHTTGIAEIPSATLRYFLQRVARTQHAHQIFKTLYMFVSTLLLWFRCVLKIRVSVVRFRPRPPKYMFEINGLVA